MHAHEAAVGRVERALKAAGLPPLAWYEVLVELEGAAACGMRPFELERALSLPQYGLSRLVARLEEAGLATRQNCPGDGRGLLVAITDAGRAMRRGCGRSMPRRCTRPWARGCRRRRRRGWPTSSAG